MKQLVVGPSASADNGTGVTLITNAILRYSELNDIYYIDSLQKKNNALTRLLNFIFPCGVINILLVFKIYFSIKENKIQKVLFIGPENGYNSLIVSTLCDIPVSYALIDNKLLIYKSLSLSKISYLDRLRSLIGYGFTNASYKILGIFNKQANFIFVSDDDAQLGAKYFKNVHIIKNGTTIRKVTSKSLIKQDIPIYVFHGDFNYQPNIIARDIFINFIVSIDNKGVVFGKNNTESPNLNVELRGYVEDINKYITASNIYFCPLTYGAGIKNKVLEALAAGMLVAGTRYAFDGIDTSKIECVLLSVDEIENEQRAQEINKIICKKYVEYNPRLNIDYIIKYHNWNDQVSKYLKL